MVQRYFLYSQEEIAITMCEKHASDDGKLVYEHQIMPDFNILNEIRHMQVFSASGKFSGG